MASPQIAQRTRCSALLCDCMAHVLVKPRTCFNFANCQVASRSGRGDSSRRNRKGLGSDAVSAVLGGSDSAGAVLSRYPHHRIRPAWSTQTKGTRSIAIRYTGSPVSLPCHDVFGRMASAAAAAPTAAVPRIATWPPEALRAGGSPARARQRNREPS